MNSTNQLGRDSTARCSGPHDQVYYPGPGVIITRYCIHTNGSWLRLADVSRFRADRGSGDIAIVASGAAALVITFLSWALTMAYQTTQDRIVIGVATATVIALLGVTAWIALSRRSYRLWVQHHGSVVLLLSTRDRHQYEAVSRAIRRAWQDLNHRAY
jgi:hypothetical protein